MMKKIDKIISEEIRRYTHRVKLNEKDNNKSRYKSNEDEADTKGTDQFAAYLKKMNDEGFLDIRSMAAKLIGASTKTDNSAQVNKVNSYASQLRKEINGEEAPGGGHYHLKQDEAGDIAQHMKKA